MGPRVLLTPEAFMRPTGGVRRYAGELEKAIASFGESERVGEGIGLSVSRIAGRRIGGSLARLAVDAQTSSLARRADIAHSVYYDCSWLGKRMPLLVTFHDCIHERLSVTGGFRSSVLAHDKRRSVERARFVLSVSKSTARDVAEFYQLEPERSIVVNPPVSEVFTSYPGILRIETDAPFFLFVGARDSYKHWNLLVRVVGLLRKQHPDVKLTSVGGGPLQSAEAELLNDAGLGDMHHNLLSNVNDEDLAALYSKSVAVVCPSSYEGFGYTVAESLCSGGSAVASDGGSLIEFGEFGCSIFEKGDFDSFRSALELALEKWSVNSPSFYNTRESAVKAFGIPSFRLTIRNLYKQTMREN